MEKKSLTLDTKNITFRKKKDSGDIAKTLKPVEIKQEKIRVYFSLLS